MKKILILLILLILVTNIAFAYKNEPDGFRGIKWGTSLDSLTGMIYFDTDSSYGGPKVIKIDSSAAKENGIKMMTVNDDIVLSEPIPSIFLSTLPSTVSVTITGFW